MKTAKDKSWNPYIAGCLTGLLVIFAVLIDGQYFGASACFVRTTGMIEKLFIPGHVADMDYFTRFAPIIDWQWMFVAGILLGAFISSVTSKDFQLKFMPDMWESRFGKSKLKRGIVAFTGGVIMMLGARVAGGCTSVYGLGTLVQLGVSGLVALMCFFAGGIVMAMILYRRQGGIK